MKIRTAEAARKLVLGSLLAVLAPAFFSVALAAGAGAVTHLSGTLSARQADGKSRLLGVKSEVQEGDVLSTEDDSYARVRFVDASEVVLRPNSQFKIENFRFNEARPESDSIVVSLLKGGLRAVTGLIGKRSRERIEYRTPTATIGIRGTNVGMLFCNNDCGNIPTPTGRPLPNGTHADVASGAIVMSNAGGSQLIGAGQFGFAGSFTSAPLLVPPAQGVQVTMPQSISQNNTQGRGLGRTGLDPTCRN